MILTGQSEQNQQKELVNRLLYGVNTCIPGIINSFDPITQTVNVTPAIQMRVQDADRQETFEDLPTLVQVPVCYPFAVTAGYALTLPIKEGDPCVLVFSQRAIENWHKLGGIQPPEDFAEMSRHHDLNDAFALMCAPALPQVLEDWLLDGIELRNRSRDTRVSVRDNRTVEVVAGTASMTTTNPGHKVVGPMTIDSSLSIGTSDSGVFLDMVGKVITVQNGIIIGGLTG
jgi:hypothetical protein